MSKHYYDIEDDLKLAPDAWCYCIVGGRNIGKTYSVLKSAYLNKVGFVLIKRTNEDVQLLCSGSGRVGTKQNDYGIDVSPFKAINRDIKSNVRAFSIKKGLGAFWECDYEDQPIGNPIGYILSLNYVTKIKGFDLSDFSDWLIFDEYIPAPWERVSHKEGDTLLDCYKTISRDREHRGKPALKLICLANATRASNPVNNTLELTDVFVQMQIDHVQYKDDKERGIFVRMIENKDFKETEEQSQIYKAMKNTQWGQMALNNTFAYNDFSNVGDKNLKGHIYVVGIKYKLHNYYIYQRNGEYYMTDKKSGDCETRFDLNLENDQKYFYYEWVEELRTECIQGKMTFKTYSMYDLIINYKEFFRL